MNSAATALEPVEQSTELPKVVVVGTGGTIHSVESVWGAVPGLLLARLPRPLAEPGVPITVHRALHGSCRQAWLRIQGLGIVLPR